MNKRLSKQPWGLWFETPPWSLWRQCNAFFMSKGWQWIAWMGLMDGCLYVWANVCRWLDADYICILFSIASSRWRHNGRDGVSNHQPHDCLLNRLLRRKSKKARKLYVTGLCAGNYNHVNAGYNNAAVTIELHWYACPETKYALWFICNEVAADQRRPAIGGNYACPSNIILYFCARLLARTKLHNPFVTIKQHSYELPQRQPVFKAQKIYTKIIKPIAL